MSKQNVPNSLSDSSSNIINLNHAREVQRAETLAQDYDRWLSRIDKAALLEEMVAFQRRRQDAGSLTLTLICQGRVLFRALERQAESEQLQILASSYSKHLEYELSHYISTGRLSG